MKIIAYIPVEKVVSPGGTTFSFRRELLEVEVVRILRYRCDRTRARYYYQADVLIPGKMCQEALSAHEVTQGMTRVNVLRDKNPKWKPPVFPEGKNNVEVSA